MGIFNSISHSFDGLRLRLALRIQNNIEQKYGRHYDAGKLSRFETDWITEANDINREIRTAKRLVDSRVYDLSKNNPYVKGYLIESKSNIVGHDGFKLQVLSKFPSGDYDEFANNLIENKFNIWAKKEYCTMSKRFSLLRVQWMIENMVCLNGEFLVRKITNLKTKDNPFGFSLEILDPYDIDWIYSGEYGENVVINGVELNQWREIKAIWVRTGPIKEELYGVSGYSGGRIRIDMSELIYDFDPDHPKQSRGMTPLSSVILSLKGVTRWEDYSLVNAQFSAGKMGFIQRTKLESQGSYSGGTGGKGKKETFEPAPGKYMDITAGSIEELPYGYEFESFDPKFPHEQHQPFLKAMLRKISTGLGLSYNSFANDLEGVNYSSMRSGLQNERSGWMMQQSFFREAFLLPVYESWLKSALNTGALAPLYPTYYEKYTEHYWQGRRWNWVDPKVDVESAAKSEKMGYASKVDIVAEKGGSVEDIFRDRAYIKKLAKKYDCMELTEFLGDPIPAIDPNADPGEDPLNTSSDTKTSGTKSIIKLAS